MALTEREKFERFIDKHGPVSADAFFWCGGSSWERRQYCAVILAKKKTQSAAVELRADTPYALAKMMRDVGYQTNARAVRPLCETAPLTALLSRTKGRARPRTLLHPVSLDR